MSDDLHQPEQPSLPARQQHRAARAAGGPGLSQSQLDSGLQRPGELGEEPALCCHAVSGQTWRHLLNVYPIEFKIVGVIHKMWFDLNCSPLIQEFHETLHSLLLWLAQAEDKLRTVNVNDRSHSALLQHRDTLTVRQTIVFLVLPYFCTNIMLTLIVWIWQIFTKICRYGCCNFILVLYRRHLFIYSHVVKTWHSSWLA